jgi:pre-60S factor REI1
VASLPPLSSEIFTEKVLTAQATSSAAAAKASFEKTCSACQKTYYSENAHRNHLKSQKHRLRVAVSHGGNGALQDDVMSTMSSSTFTLGEPIDVLSKDSIDGDAEAELTDIVDGLKETALDDRVSVSRNTSNPHTSATEERPLEENGTKPPSNDAIPAQSHPGAEKLDVSLKRCMFCNYESPTFKLSVMHMNKFHGMFIPEQPYLADLEGLIGYLYAKVTKNHECLYCHKLKSSMSGIQTHMRDKGHCMIAFESEEEMVEVGQFYDFSSTYSDDGEDDMIDELERTNDEFAGGVSLGSRQSKALKTVICTSNGDEEMRDGKVDNEGWETDSSASSLDSEDLTAVPIDHTHAFERLSLHRHHSHTDPRPHRSADGFHSHAHSHRAVFRSDYELYLPSGRTAGHRSLARYFRQNLHSYPTISDRMQSRLIEESSFSTHSDNDRGREITTRANGGSGMLGVTEAHKREVRAVEKRERKRGQRAQDQYQWGVDKRGNSQKHFRDPLLQ